MTIEYSYFFGCVLIAWSLPFAIFLFIIVRQPQLVVIAFASSFFYLMAIVINTILWSIVPFLSSARGLFVFIGVIIIEIIRPQYIKFFRKFHRSFEIYSTNRVIFPLNELFSGISSGFGWGVTHILLFYTPIIAKSVGPGTYFRNNCSLSVITRASIYSPFIFLNNIFLMIIFFDCMNKKHKQWWFGVISHIFASLWLEFKMSCKINIIGTIIITFGLAITVIYITRKPQYRRKVKGI